MEKKSQGEKGLAKNRRTGMVNTKPERSNSYIGKGAGESLFVFRPGIFSVEAGHSYRGSKKPRPPGYHEARGYPRTNHQRNHRSDMSDANWKEAYEEILLQEKGEKDDGEFSIGDERRKQPRFRIKSGYVWIKIQPRFFVVDVSVSGISLLSDYPFEIGEELSIILGKALNIVSVVKECVLVQSDEALLENKYLVRCSFENEQQGMEFLVMIKETDELDLEIGGKAPPSLEKDELELELDMGD